MNNYRLLIQYDGGRYKGWQRLGNEENTIQGKIENVLSKMVGEPIEIIGSSRTDAGVHALGQVANFKIVKSIPEEEIKAYMNHYLPNDISILEVTKVSEQFHARFHAKDKTYLYKIWNQEHSNPFMRKYSMHIPQRLDVKKMIEASQHFIGEHDFTAFSNAKSKKKSMVRRILSIEINEEEGFINVRIRGDGFLYNMARWMLGTLVGVGLGEIEAQSIPEIILSKQRNRTGNIAEACGLYLERINY